MRAAGEGRNLEALGAALLLALVAGCSQNERPVLAPPADLAPPDNLSPQIEAVFPEARSTGVLYDTDIWVRFVEPLDPATVSERTVFFKLDTVRLPVTLTYDGATRTIRLAPRGQLALLRTYTVEITTGVETADQQPLSQTSFWQFKTNGLRRLVNPIPAERTTGESPFALLQWGRTEAAAGSIVYDVYSGADSAAVAARGARPIQSSAQPFLIPLKPWGFGARVYWAVTAVNRTSSERLDGPVWSFETLPPGIPVDSLVVPAGEWGYYDIALQRLFCLTGFISAGTGYNNGIHWLLRETAAGLKLAGARVTVYATGVTISPAAKPVIHPVNEPWAPCSYSPYIPKVVNTKLADGVRVGTSQFLMFESDAFTAYLEAGARYDVVYGFSFRANQGITYLSPENFVGPRLVLYYYRIPPAPGAAQGP